MKKGKIYGIVFVTIGISLPLVSLLFLSNYDRREHFVRNLIRNIFTGEIILRESVVELIPDRDEKLYRKFIEYKSKHPEFKTFSEDEIIDKFYDENYKDKMYRMEFVLKLTKQKIMTHKSKIAIPYKYILLFGFVLLSTGSGFITLTIIRNRKK